MPIVSDDLYYPSADGRLTLYARIVAGDGPALLLMHGLTRNGADFDGLIEHLAGRFVLVVPDQRGRGRSDYDANPAHYVPATYCADMLSLIARLKLKRPVLIGTSMGGLMAMMMAAIQPAAYRGLILNDIGPEVEQAGLLRIASYVGAGGEVSNWTEAADYCRRIYDYAFPNYGDAEWQTFARRVYSESAEGAPRLAYDPAIASGLISPSPTAVPPNLWPLWDSLAGLPILTIRGGQSDILGAATLERMGERHPGMQRATVPGVGHAPMLDEPEACQAIASFLANFAV